MAAAVPPSLPELDNKFSCNIAPFRIGSSEDGTITKQVVTMARRSVYFLGNIARSTKAAKFTSQLPAGPAWDDILNHSTLDKFAALGREERENFRKAILPIFRDPPLAWIKDDAWFARSWTDVKMHEPMRLSRIYRKCSRPPFKTLVASWPCPSLDAGASGP
jgi:hypothetical protein